MFSTARSSSLLEFKETQATANLEKKSVCLLSTLRVTFRAICPIASKEQGMPIVNGYLCSTDKKRMSHEITIGLSGQLGILISIYDMNCFTEAFCGDIYVSTCKCKEVVVAALNADIGRCKYPNGLTEICWWEACLLFNYTQQLV